jgi:hypothetical protein
MCTAVAGVRYVSVPFDFTGEVEGAEAVVPVEGVGFVGHPREDMLDKV